jgi:hypothetical protein
MGITIAGDRSADLVSGLVAHHEGRVDHAGAVERVREVDRDRGVGADLRMACGRSPVDMEGTSSPSIKFSPPTLSQPVESMKLITKCPNGRAALIESISTVRSVPSSTNVKGSTYRPS